MVAMMEATSPDSRTANSNKPKERVEKCPLLEKKAGAIASSAESVPVSRPQPTRKAFSVTTIKVKCRAL